MPNSQGDSTSPIDHLLLNAAAAASPVSSGGDSFSTKATVRTAPAPAIAISPASREDGINGEHDAASVSARLRPEPDEMGNLEYKLRLLPTTRHRYDRLLTQLKWRLLQGGGVCTYEVGVLDDGRCVGICEAEMRVSLEVLGALAAELDACVRIRRAFAVETVENAASDTSSSRAAPGNASEKSSEAGTSLRCLSSETVKQRLLDEQAIEESDSSSGCAGGCLFGSGEIGPGPGQQITTEGKGPVSVFIAPRPDIDGAPSSSSRRLANVDVDIEWEEQDVEPDPFSTAVDGDASPRASGTAHPHDSTSNELFGEVFQPDDDELADFTFSLSLDERETRDGVGYRKPPKKKQPQQKDSEIEAKMLGLAHPSTTATDQRSPIGLPVEASAAAKNTPKQLSSNAMSAEQSTTAPSQQADAPKTTCRRVIVEAVVTKTVAEEAFIDYASL